MSRSLARSSTATAYLRDAARSENSRSSRLLEPLRIEFGFPQRRFDAGLRRIERQHRLVERLHHLVQQSRRFRRLALQPSEQAGELRQRRILSGQHVLCVLDLRRDLLGAHHRGADFGETGLFAGLRIELRQFRDRGTQIVGLARGSLHPRLMAPQFLLGLAPMLPRCLADLHLSEMAAEGIEQLAVRSGVDQRPFVMLAVDFDQRPPDVAHQGHAGWLVVDEDAGPSVGALHPAQDDVAVVVQRVLGEDRPCRVVLRHVEHRDHLPLARAMAHQRRIAARAERQRQRIEQDGFAGTGFAGKD